MLLESSPRERESARPRDGNNELHRVEYFDREQTLSGSCLSLVCGVRGKADGTPVVFVSLFAARGRRGGVGGRPEWTCQHRTHRIYPSRHCRLRIPDNHSRVGLRRALRRQTLYQRRLGTLVDTTVSACHF